MLSTPADDISCLAVPILLTSVQEVPFHNSVFAVFGGVHPPAATADVAIPNPVKSDLASFKSATSAQLVPFQSSVTAC